MKTSSIRFPRSSAAVAGLAFLGMSLCYLFGQEPPVGTVRGRVLMSENHLPLGEAEINLTMYDTADMSTGHPFSWEPTRHAKSQNDGTFVVNRVPAGTYLVTASSLAHATVTANAVFVTVEEGRVSPIDVNLDRSQPEFVLHQGQVIFGTDEKAKLGLTGYVDVSKAQGAEAMHLSVWKTKLSSVLQNSDAERLLDTVGRTYDHVKTIPDLLLQPGSGAAPTKVIDSEIPITEADHEGFFHKRYNFDLMTPGLYLVGVSHAGLTDCTWLLVTNIALVEKRANQQLVAYVVDMKTGTPLPNSEIRAYKNGDIIARAQSSDTGIAEITLPESKKTRHVAADAGDDSGDDPGADTSDSAQEKARITTVAVRGDDEAVITKDYYRNEDAGSVAVHSYTDRPIYRPGQRIYFKDIVRLANPESSRLAGQPRYSTPSGKAIKVELRDPQGEKLMAVNGVTSAEGCYWGQAELDAEAPTGVYSLITTFAGEVHTHDIVIASYRKPEFTVTVTPDKSRYTRGDAVTMTISAAYFFGAPVAGAKVEYSVYRDRDYDSANSDVDPEDQAEDQEENQGGESDRYSFFGADVTQGKAQLDENGKAVVTFKADAPQDPEGPQQDKYTLTATITEGEDNTAEATGVAHVTTGDFNLNVQAEGSLASPGSPDSLVISATDIDGHAVPNLQVEVEAGYHSWADGEYSYDMVSKAKTTLNADGTGVYPLVPPRQGELLVKVRAWDAKGHKIVARTYVWVASDSAGDMDTEYADLSLHTDKCRYNPGETARVLVNSVRIGETVLLTIEGDHVYHTQLVKMTGRSQVVRVPIVAPYGPNVYLDACYVRNKKFASSETPLRVTMPAAQLNVSISADRNPPPSPSKSANALARYQPEERITYHIRTTDDAGKPIKAELSFGVVDEAIYALKEDSPNALRDDFYPRRFNAVQTEYSFSIAFMGDADKSEPEMVTRKQFPDTAYWNPDLKTDEAGNATVSFTLKDSLTTWRATATANTPDTRVGRTTQKVIVSKDFLVRLEAPRFLTQKDKSRLVTAVHNDTGMTQTVTVKLELQNLGLQGSNVQTATLEPGQRGELVWAVDAVTVGDAVVTVKAWTAKSADGRQFTDALENRFPIMAHGREQAQALAGAVTAGQPKTETVNLAPDSIKGTARLTVRITPSLAGAMLNGADYLIGYPYGCTEQTMSRFLPDLMVARALKVNGVGAVPNADKIPKMVRNALLRLGRFQHESGAWGWWEHDADDAWMTAYVLYGLSESKADGYSVNDRMLQRGRQAAVKMLQDKNIAVNTKVFLMYGLALAGNTDVPREESQKLRLSDLTAESIGYLVLLDRKLSTSTSFAMTELEKRSKFGDSMIYWGGSNKEYPADWNELEATAVALRAIIAVDKNDPRIELIIRWLMYHRTGGYWTSTRDTSYALMALCEYLTAHGSTSTGGSVSVSLNGSLLQNVPLSASTLGEKEIIIRAPAASVRPGDNRVTLERTGGNTPIFYSVEMKQMVGAEDIKAIAPVMAVTSHLLSEPKHTGVKGGDPANQLIISRVYQRLVVQKSGSSDYGLQTEATNNQLVDGDRIRVKLTITAPREMDYVLIEDPFPAGCEVSERGSADEVVEWGYWYSSVDIRDSKIAFFARSVPKGVSVIEYNLRAKTHGSYHAMPTLLQGMYSPDMHAESAEDRVMIR